MSGMLPAKDMIVSSPYAFQGGLDQTSSSLAIPATRCIAALNYEPTVTGYQRHQGYERCDGRLPSETDYWVLPFIDGQTQLRSGETVTGSVSGATGRLVLDPENLTGSWGDGTASGTLILVAVTGTFDPTEALKVVGSVCAVCDGLAAVNGASTPENEARWVEAAQDWMRHLIQKVPGSGAVRGVLTYGGTLYAVRDNEAATKGRMFKATAAGWVEQAFGRLLRFKTGLAGPNVAQPPVSEGDQVIGQTSGAKAVVSRIVARTGTWGAVTSDADKAAGYLIVANQTGQFKAGEALKTATAAVATVDTGDSAEIVLPPGGRYAFKVKNFYGGSDLKRVYGVNGVGTGFEYDGGNVLVPIETGMPEGKDKPDHIFDIGNASASPSVAARSRSPRRASRASSMPSSAPPRSAWATTSLT
jgi:hypothetical protein